jgi:HlyD family secretion protein
VALRSAEAQAETARADLSRARTLYDKDIIAKAAYDQKLLASTQADRAVEEARAALARFEAEDTDEQPDVVVARRQLEAAEASLERAVADLEQARVRAPIAGTVLDVHARPGEKPGTDGLLDMGDVDRMAAKVEIYESDIGRVEIGDPVTIEAAALKAPLRGRVERIGLQVKRQSVIDADPAVNTDARVVEVWVALDAASSQRAARFTNLQVHAEIGAAP